MLEWEWLGIDSQERPPQRLDWEIYRLEHLSFVSNVESSFASWLSHPWHMGNSALRCMACQSWQAQHVCPICKRSDRNIGGVHNPWSYVEGCLSHLSTGSGCIGALLNADSPELTGQSMILSTAELLAQLHPPNSIRDFMPAVTIVYMRPGRHRQWPMSINALLDRFSLLIFKTRKLALLNFRTAVQNNPKWRPNYYKGTKVATAPSPPIKFLDIGTRLGLYEIREHIPRTDDKLTSFIQGSKGKGFPDMTPFTL